MEPDALGALALFVSPRSRKLVALPGRRAGDLPSPACRDAPLRGALDGSQRQYRPGRPVDGVRRVAALVPAVRVSGVADRGIMRDLRPRLDCGFAVQSTR